MVYVGKRYTVTATGAAMRGACCENCGCEYLYRIERAAKGEGSSPYFLGAESAKRRAAKEAQDSLQRQLRDVDPVPCPDCGWLQDAMVRKMRQKYYWILGPTVFAAVCLGLVFYFAKGVGQPFSMETHLYAAAGTVLLVALWWILRSNFDPNRVKSLRRNDENDTTRAILRSEYEPRLAEFPPEMRFALVKVMKEIDQAKRDLALSPREQFDFSSAADTESACKRRANIQLAAWAVIGLVALLAIGPASGGYAERSAYDKVMEQKTIDAADRYLREYPQGAHAEEVRGLLKKLRSVFAR